MHQLAQVHDQCQALVVPQHSPAVRHVRGRVVQQRLRRRRVRPNYFVRRNADVRIFAALVPGQDSHDHAAWQQPRPSAFRDRDVHHRNNRTRVTSGQSTTSSTSNTGRQNRSRPARKTQNCRVGSACSTDSGISSSSSAAESGESGSKCVSLGIRRIASLHAGDLPGQTV